MKKHRGVTVVYLERENKIRRAIYEHEGKFYILSNSRCSVYNPFWFEGKEYTEVKNLGDEFWHIV